MTGGAATTAACDRGGPRDATGASMHAGAEGGTDSEVADTGSHRAVLGLFATGLCPAYLTMADIATLASLDTLAATTTISGLLNAGLLTLWAEAPGGASVTLTPYGASQLGVRLVRKRWRYRAKPERSERVAIRRLDSGEATNLPLEWDPSPEDDRRREYDPLPLVWLTGSATVWRERHRKRCRCDACLCAWPDKTSGTRHKVLAERCLACGGEKLKPGWHCGRCDAPKMTRPMAITEAEREEEKRVQAQMRGLRGGRG